MPYTIRVRRDSSANWTGVVLAVGEVGYDSTNNQFRVGDGTTAWGTLSPIGGGHNFGTIAVTGQSNVVAEQSNDTLTLAAGSNITLTTNANTDTITIAASGVTDGNKGDITVSGTGATWTINNGVITYAKIQDVSTTDRLLGRSSAGAGVIEEITCTSAGRALLDDIDAAAQRTTLGLGTIATQNSTNVSITGGSLEGVSVVTGTYSSPVNEAVLIKARKSTAGTINKGEIVYIVGSSGSHMTVELARADVESTSAYTIGVAATSITNTTDGYIMQQGRLTGLNTLPTATYANGDTIYLSESTAGGYRKTPPTAPNHGVFIGFVINASNGSAGELDVRIQNYQELSELSDVLISGIGANHMIVWDNTDLRWENKSPADTRTALGLGTLATQSGTFSGTSSGTNTGDQTITLTGDVTGSGTGSFAATIANDAVTYAKMQNVSAASRILGRGSAAGSGDPQELTVSNGISFAGTVLNGQNVTLDTQIFHADSGTQNSSTWTKPANARLIIMVGSGGGGGGQAGSTTAAGIGGAAGQGYQSIFDPAILGATEPVTIGLGGNAGAVGNGTYITAAGFIYWEGGNGGADGRLARTVTGNAATDGFGSGGQAGGGLSARGRHGGYGAGGGGGGGGTSGNDGGAGGYARSFEFSTASIAAGGGGAAGGTGSSGAAGSNSSTTNLIDGYGHGAGGGSRHTAGTGGAGGNGYRGSGGGGGGQGSTAGGAGGKGGNGFLIVHTLCWA